MHPRSRLTGLVGSFGVERVSEKPASVPCGTKSRETVTVVTCNRALGAVVSLKGSYGNGVG